MSADKPALLPGWQRAALVAAPGGGTFRLPRLGAARFADNGAARLAAARRDLAPGLPRRLSLREGGSEAANMPPIKPGSSPAKLTLSEALNAWGPADLVAEFAQTSGGTSKPDRERHRQVCERVNVWFRNQLGSGSLRISGQPDKEYQMLHAFVHQHWVNTRKVDSAPNQLPNLPLWEELSRDIAHILSFNIGENRVFVEDRGWKAIRVCCAADTDPAAVPAEGAGALAAPDTPADTTSNRGRPLAKHLLAAFGELTDYLYQEDPDLNGRGTQTLLIDRLRSYFPPGSAPARSVLQDHLREFLSGYRKGGERRKLK